MNWGLFRYLVGLNCMIDAIALFITYTMGFKFSFKSKVEFLAMFVVFMILLSTGAYLTTEETR